MKVRDSYARINGNDEVFEVPSGGLEIIGEGGRTLFSLRLVKNVLHVSAGDVCKIDEQLFDDRFVIRPIASNCVDLVKVKYEEQP